jgi:hypothetical protein
MPDKSFGYVPTPALVAPIEFSMRREDYIALGGYADRIRSLDDLLKSGERQLRSVPWQETHAWPLTAPKPNGNSRAQAG